MTTSRPRIVFIDVDGTILEHGAVMAPSTAPAIRAARAAGHQVWLATGRSEGDLHPDVLAIGFDGAITNGGAFATRGGEVILARTMPLDDVTTVRDYLDANSMHYFLQAHTEVYASSGVMAMMAEFLRSRAAKIASEPAQDTAGDLMDAVMKDAGVRYLPASDADLESIAKVVFLSERDGKVAEVSAALGERFHVIPGSLPLPGGSNGEISPAGVHKGAAITEVLSQLGIDPADAVGIGDSWNDAEMFDVVGTAVAMAGADPELQARAGRVTTGVLDDGVANALADLGLISR